MRRVMTNSVGFILGFSVVSSPGPDLHRNRADAAQYKQHTQRWWRALVIILFGLHLTGILKIRALYSDTRLQRIERWQHAESARL